MGEPVQAFTFDARKASQLVRALLVVLELCPLPAHSMTRFVSPESVLRRRPQSS